MFVPLLFLKEKKQERLTSLPRW